jgi:hypothetical protein
MGLSRDEGLGRAATPAEAEPTAAVQYPASKTQQIDTVL